MYASVANSVPMALSDDEQRRLDGIEAALLADDPQFVRRTSADMAQGEISQRFLHAQLAIGLCVVVIVLGAGGGSGVITVRSPAAAGDPAGPSDTGPAAPRAGSRRGAAGHRVQHCAWADELVAARYVVVDAMDELAVGSTPGAGST